MLIPVHCCLAILRPDSLLAVPAAQYVKQGLKTFDRSSEGLLLSAVRAVYINRERRALAANVGSDTLTAVDVAEHRLTCEAVTDNCCKRNMSVFSTTCYGCKRQYYRVHAQILHFWTENPNTLVTACNLQVAIGALNSTQTKPKFNAAFH